MMKEQEGGAVELVSDSDVPSLTSSPTVSEPPQQCQDINDDMFPDIPEMTTTDVPERLYSPPEINVGSGYFPDSQPSSFPFMSPVDPRMSSVDPRISSMSCVDPRLSVDPRMSSVDPRMSSISIDPDLYQAAMLSPVDALRRASEIEQQLMQINSLTQSLSQSLNLGARMSMPSVSRSVSEDQISQQHIPKTRLTRTQSACMDSKPNVNRTKRQIKLQIRRQMKQQLKKGSRISLPASLETTSSLEPASWASLDPTLCRSLSQSDFDFPDLSGNFQMFNENLN
jgi:hypothetical protein